MEHSVLVPDKMDPNVMKNILKDSINITTRVALSS
jgi:hypothetical protein